MPTRVLDLANSVKTHASVLSEEDEAKIRESLDLETKQRAGQLEDAEAAELAKRQAEEQAKKEAEEAERRAAVERERHLREAERAKRESAVAAEQRSNDDLLIDLDDEPEVVPAQTTTKTSAFSGLAAQIEENRRRA